MNSSAETALWAAGAAFCGNVLGLKVLEKITDDTLEQWGLALLASAFVAGAVYCKERLTAARKGGRGDA